MDNFLKTTSALNDETRIRIIKFLNINGTCCVCDLENSFDMIQSRLSRHLKILKDADFLKVDRVGKWAYYSISTHLDEFKQSVIKEIMALNIDLPELKRACEN
ncbi:ArsR/SmtB family transcription factor [Aliarcobacter cryaerophilus]|uniref:ArsR/SmtB family transcription factor n=1 Tax=Aliarcobacter cryaerophilus TaxID=28198 RepID=UPI003DA33A99